MNFVAQCVKNRTVIVFAVEMDSFLYPELDKFHSLTCKLAHFVSVMGEIHQETQELEQNQEEMSRRINFSNQHRTGDELEDEVSKGLHQPDIR